MKALKPGCMHGNPIGSGCKQCEALTDKACERFEREVFLGTYDSEGYTPAERKAQIKRRRDDATV